MNPAWKELAELPGADEAGDEESIETSELADWKAALRRDFETWLETVEEVPNPDDNWDGPEAPDLYSFFEQMVVANAESRKANRRTAEAFSQWGDVLTRFEGDLRLLREQLSNHATAGPTDEAIPRSFCLALVEILDRMRRLARAFNTPPGKSWWGGDSQWRKAWATQRQAFEILLSHLEALLKKEGVVTIDTLGQPFDPAVMTAVATEIDPQRPHHTVIEEIAPGYRYRGELLRVAQVKVTLNKP